MGEESRPHERNETLLEYNGLETWREEDTLRI